jgi:hypothetical protein
LGKVPVRLLGVTSSCGCTLAEPLEQSDLAPGESTELRLRGTPPEVGEKRSYFEVQSNSTRSPALRVHVLLRGKEIPLPRVMHTPDRVALQSHRAEHRVTQFEVETLERAGTPDWLGRPPQVPEPFETALQGRREAPGPEKSQIKRTYQYTVAATVSPNALREVEVNLAALGTNRVPVRLIVEYVPAIRPAPAALFWRITAGSKFPQTRRIVFLGSGPASDTQAEIHPESTDIAWLGFSRLESSESGTPVVAKFDVSLLAAPPLASGAAEHRLRFRTGHPDCPIIEMPVVIVRE